MQKRQHEFIPCTMARSIGAGIFFRPVRSWHSATYAASPAKPRYRRIVTLEAPVSLEAAFTPAPSTSKWMICLRFSKDRRFMTSILYN